MKGEKLQKEVMSKLKVCSSQNFWANGSNFFWGRGGREKELKDDIKHERGPFINREKEEIGRWRCEEEEKETGESTNK